MKETISNDDMWKYIHQYYGYGCVDAPVYLIGQEEGGGNIDYRYDRFINAAEGTYIDTPNPIDPNKTIRTLDGSAFHKQIKLLEQKDSLAENIVRKIFEDNKVKVDKDIIVSYIPDKIFVDRQIDHNNRDERRQLNSEIIKAKNDLSALLNSKVQELLTNKQISTITSDYIPTRFIHLKEWLYSGNIETEMTQSTFTPIVDNIISPLYKDLFNKIFNEREFQAKYMARIKSEYQYPLFVSELYPLACNRITSIKAWEDINCFCNNEFISPVSHQTYSSIYNNQKSSDYDDTTSNQYRELRRLILNSKYKYYDDIAVERYKTLKELVIKNKPKVVIFYGGIGANADAGDPHFNQYWDKIADCNWLTITSHHDNYSANYHIGDNGNTIFVKMYHPSRMNYGRFDERYFSDICNSIVSYIIKDSKK